MHPHCAVPQWRLFFLLHQLGASLVSLVWHVIHNVLSMNISRPLKLQAEWSWILGQNPHH